jgi:hypothetical protein
MIGSEWTTVIARQAILSVVCRTINRVLVGLPLCKHQFDYQSSHISHIQGRDPDYRSLNEQFTLDVIKAGGIINLFPISLRQ